MLMVAATMGIIAGVTVELVRGGDGPAHRSITEHSGTLHWTPRGPNPAPDLTAHLWTWDYPAAYAPRVRTGIGVYYQDERIGYVSTKRVDQGTVWVYAWIAPEYEHLARDAVETEPIIAADGPRIQIYRVSPVPPAGTEAA